MTHSKSSYCLSCDLAHIDHKSHNLSDIFETVCRLLQESNFEVSSEFAVSMLQSERRQSSAIGSGVSLKHMRLAHIKAPVTVLVKSDTAIDFKAFDGNPCNIHFFVFTPDSNGPLYLQIMARAARILKAPEIAGKILGATDSAALMSIFMDKELHNMAA